MKHYKARPKSSDSVRIGVGAGFAGDRLQPANDLAGYGQLDALVFECLAERTIALAQQRKSEGVSAGFDGKLLGRLEGAMPHLAARGGVAITNAGAASPREAAIAVAAESHRWAERPLRVAAVTGDDVLQLLDFSGAVVLETGEPLASYRDRVVSANAYLGSSGVTTALRAGADIVITGRTSDAALFEGTLSALHGWQAHDQNQVAQGLMIGHLLECAAQLSGGYFADGVTKVVPELWNVGFPMADVSPDGVAVLHKLIGTGGRIDRQTVLEQLLYEVDDPSCYKTPDLAVDFSSVELVDLGNDQVRVSGCLPVEVPQTLKVSVGIRDGFAAIGTIVYGGIHSLQRASIATEIMQERWAKIYGRNPEEISSSVLGIDATAPWVNHVSAAPDEVMVRFTLRTFDEKLAAAFCGEVESLYTNGPAGGGGATASYSSTIGVVSTLIPAGLVEQKVEFFQ